MSGKEILDNPNTKDVNNTIKVQYSTKVVEFRKDGLPSSKEETNEIGTKPELKSKMKMKIVKQKLGILLS